MIENINNPERREDVETARAAPPRMTHEGRESRTLTDLLKELRDETTLLMRQEVALAKTEMTEKAKVTVRNAISIVAGGVVAYAGLLFLLLALSTGIAVAMAAAGMEDAHTTWVAPLIVGAIVAIIGYAMIQKGISTLRQQSYTPEKTMRSLREDKEWAKERMQ